MIAIEVPGELAEALAAEGLTAGRFGARGQVGQVLVEGFASAATVISLFQGPETFVNLARLLKESAGRKRRDEVKVSVKGPNVKIEFVVTQESDVKVIAKFLKDALIGELKTPSSGSR
ncbi:hypothetical protein AB0L70_35915 [Kribbella sp. NPDC051952]|uniref:hypothetical protein n=1 Tax=Kribbella sp. NPDC051952 TaxID=3154851 RepID=UPI00343D71D8